MESANVVGYLDYNLAYGYNFFAPVFEKVDPTENLMLSDIKLEDAGDGLSLIQIITTNGTLGPSYYWFSAITAGTSEDCWFDQDAWEPVDFTLTDGQGFYISSGTANAKAKVNGQVRNDVFRVPLAYGYNCVGNSTPVDLDIQDIKLENAGDGLSLIQVVTTNGTLGPSYYWFSAITAGTSEDCWFDQDAWEPVSGVTYLAGEGFYLSCGTANGTLVLPSAL